MNYSTQSALQLRNPAMFKSFLGAVAVAAIYAGSVHAVLLAYDGFDYTPAANLTPQSGGTGAWDSAWRTGPTPAVTATIESTGLSYPGLVVNGLAGDSVTGGATSNNFRDVGPFNSGDVWFSFLARPQAANSITGGSNFFGLSMYEGTDAGAGAVMGIAKNSTTTQWGLVAFPTSTGGSGPHGTGTQNASFVPPGAPDVVVNQTYLLVAHIHYATGVGTDTADMMSLYVNPTPGGSVPAIADVSYTDTMGTTIGEMSFDRVRFASQNGRDWLFDELRIGDSFADVAPLLPPNTDFNGGGTDISDFHVLRMNYLTGTTNAQGDANFDGFVNHVDFFLWRTEFLGGGGSLSAINWSCPSLPLAFS